MEPKKNYQKELERLLGQIPRGKKLLLHSCCAPCSSYCLEYLREYFQITVFYYNPNISASEEYYKRVQEQIRLIEIYNTNRKELQYPIDVISGDYRPEEFYQIAKGYEECPEGGERCHRCFQLRLQRTAEEAVQGEFDYFGTTLTISPLKNAEVLNQIGQEIAKKMWIKYLPSDFKKKGGYLRSIELSKEYELYRQDYCGCIFSKAQRDKNK